MNKSIKSDARSLLKNSSPRPMLISAVFVLLLMIVSFLSFQLFGKYMVAFIGKLMQNIDMSDPSKFADSLYKFYATIDPDRLAYEFANAMPPMSSRLLHALLIAVVTVIGVGFLLFCMNTVSGKEPALGNLLDGFGHLLRIAVLLILEALFLFLWSLLFFFPAVIAFYRYRLALFLLLDRPEMSPMQCILESSRIMKGHKTDLFVLDLSFIGWFLLVYLADMLGASSGIALLSVVGLGYLVYIPLLPYIGLSNVLFYKSLCPDTPFFDEDAFLPEL